MPADRRQKKFPNLRAGAPTKRAKSTAKAGGSTKWAKGQSGNPRGRTPGVPNRVTREAKAFAESILTDPLVQQRILEDARRGRLAPPVMTMLMGYAWGKPKDNVELKVTEELVITITDDIGEGDPTIARASTDAAAP